MVPGSFFFFPPGSVLRVVFVSFFKQFTASNCWHELFFSVYIKITRIAQSYSGEKSSNFVAHQCFRVPLKNLEYVF